MFAFTVPVYILIMNVYIFRLYTLEIILVFSIFIRDLVLSVSVCFTRDIMCEIRRLRLEQEKHTQVALSRGDGGATAVQTRNPILMAELRGLRQRRDELERRMAGLQSSRRELMTQLDGLMRLLRAVSSQTQYLLISPLANVSCTESSPSSTFIITIYYYSASRLILNLPSHRG